MVTNVTAVTMETNATAVLKWEWGKCENFSLKIKKYYIPRDFTLTCIHTKHTAYKLKGIMHAIF